MTEAEVVSSPPMLTWPKDVSLDDPSLYFNRELSWLEFNRRVLEEAQDQMTPALEKLKFTSIFSSNLDEYFMIRVGGLATAFRANINDRDPSGLTVREQLDQIADKVRGLVAEQYRCLRGEVLPQLQEAGIFINKLEDLNKEEIERLDSYFDEQVFPILTPLAVDAGHPFPFLNNLRLNLMVVFEEAAVRGESPRAFAFVEVPSVIPRLVPVEGAPNEHRYVLLEDLLRKNISRLFPGMTIQKIFAFRVTRNRDYDLHADQVVDMLQSIEDELRERSHQIGIRLEVEPGVPKRFVNTLIRELGIEETFAYEIDGPINICDLLPIYDLPVDARFKDPPFNPRIPPRFANREKDIFAIIRDGDVLVHHPYDSFAVVLDFLNAAADDPDVLAIKQTLYRIGKDSPVIGCLCRAAQNGKQVTAVVELKARFDEEYNIDWSHEMQRSGVNAVFGFVRWKTHCKATLVVRREGKRLRRYVHVSSGNYNFVTAKQYTDIGLLTCNEDFGADVAALFNALTGFNSWSNAAIFTDKTLASMFRKFMVSPVTTRDTMIQLIDREIKKSSQKNPGRIICKLNAVVDHGIVRKLYEASQAGVQIDLMVRGICCLRPGIPGISENIRVTSILDRFLEHSRVYYFENGGEAEIYSGSADFMERNFIKRSEIVYPIENKDLKARILNEILYTYLADNVKARAMQPDGSYVRRKPKDGEPAVRSQSALIETARSGGIKSRPYEEVVKMIGIKKLPKRGKRGED